MDSHRNECLSMLHVHCKELGGTFAEIKQVVDKQLGAYQLNYMFLENEDGSGMMIVKSDWASEFRQKNPSESVTISSMGIDGLDAVVNEPETQDIKADWTLICLPADNLDARDRVLLKTLDSAPMHWLYAFVWDLHWQLKKLFDRDTQLVCHTSFQDAFMEFGEKYARRYADASV